MALWRESKEAQDSATAMTRTIPTTQLGSCSRRRKNATLPSWGGSPGQAPDQAAMQPVMPTRTRMTRTQTQAVDTPIQRSRSVLEAKVRSQKLDRKKSLVRIATGKMYRSCQPRRFASVRPEEAIREGSISVRVPMAMVAMTMRPRTMTPWMLSVRKEIRKPPSAEM